MSNYEFPLPSTHELVERIDEPALGAEFRHWTLRDDNNQQHHGILPLSPDPLLLELRWKARARGREQIVGLYRLHLAGLLADGYVRREGDDSSRQVPLRFHRGARGVVSIQINSNEPALPIGMVDQTLA